MKRRVVAALIAALVFWNDDRDIPSKRVFGFVVLLFSMAETGRHLNLAVLTIPAG